MFIYTQPNLIHREFPVQQQQHHHHGSVDVATRSCAGSHQNYKRKESAAKVRAGSSVFCCCHATRQKRFRHVYTQQQGDW
jgi:hypothetical protein